jgi:hypothetical protein
VLDHDDDVVRIHFCETLLILLFEVCAKTLGIRVCVRNFVTIVRVNSTYSQ